MRNNVGISIKDIKQLCYWSINDDIGELENKFQ